MTLNMLVSLSGPSAYEVWFAVVGSLKTHCQGHRLVQVELRDLMKPRQKRQGEAKEDILCLFKQ